MNREILKEEIKRHEGEVLEIYKDSLGYLTLGVGHLIREDDEEYGEPEGTPISQEVVDRYYEADFDKHLEETYHVCEKNNMNFDVLTRRRFQFTYFLLFLLDEAPERKNRSILTTVVKTDTEKDATTMAYEHDTHWDAKG